MAMRLEWHDQQRADIRRRGLLGAALDWRAGSEHGPLAINPKNRPPVAKGFDDGRRYVPLRRVGVAIGLDRGGTRFVPRRDSARQDLVALDQIDDAAIAQRWHRALGRSLQRVLIM